MNSRAARAIAVLVLGLATLGIVTPASAASTTAGTASVSLWSTDFSSARSGTPLQLELSIEDTVGAGIGAGSATVHVSRTPFTSRSALTRWLDGTTKDSTVATTVVNQATPVITAGGNRLLSIAVPSKSLGFRAAGVYAISVSVASGDSVIGGARSAVSWKPSASDPVPFAIAAPLTLPAATGEFISAKTLELATAPDGVLTRKLDDLADRPVAIGIDPRIIASIRILGNAAPQSALDWLNRLATVTNDTFPLAWADADLTLAQQAGAPNVPRVKPLTYAIVPDRFATPDTTTTTSTPAPTQTPDPGTGGSTDPALPASNDDLIRWNYTINQIAWPADNTVTKADMTKFGIAGLPATILSSSNTKRSQSGNSVGAAATIGAMRVATSDEQLSGYLAAAVQATTRAASNSATTNLAAALDQIAVSSTSTTPVVLATLPRNWDDDGIAFDRILSTVFAQSWVATASLTDVLSAKATATSIISKPQAADRLSLVRGMLSIENKDARFASVVDDPEALTSSRRLILLSILSAEWVGNDAGWSAAARSFVNSGRKIVRSVQVEDSSDVLFLGASGALPITISNAYSQGVTVYLTLHPATTRLSISNKYTNYKVQIPANAQAKIRIPVQSLSNGKASVGITLTSVTGRVVGTDKTVNVNVQAAWETVGTAVVAALVLGIFGFGLFRSIRRRRRARLSPVPQSVESTTDSAEESSAGE